MTLNRNVLKIFDDFAHFGRRIPDYLSTLFTLCFLFITPVLAQALPAATCKEIFAGASKKLATDVQIAQIDNTDIVYMRVQRAEIYRVSRDLPRLNDAFLIHMSPDGHVMLWYQNRRIDSGGSPLIEVMGFMRKTHILHPGVVFAIHKLPEGFGERFQEFIENYRGRSSVTCVSNACGSLARLGLNEVAPRKYLTATRFFHHLIKLAANSRGDVEVWSLGQDLRIFEAEVRVRQHYVTLTNGIALLTIGAFPAAWTMMLLQ